MGSSEPKQSVPTKWLLAMMAALIVAGVAGSISSQISISEWKGQVDQSLKHLAEDGKRERDHIYRQLTEIKDSLRRLEAKSK